jgi:hypothetical protein
MGSHVKEHRAPVRYNLTVAEKEKLTAIIQRQGFVPDKQVRGFARQFGCATKPIVNLVSGLHMDITPAPDTPPKTETARERAERHFQPGKTPPVPESEATPEVEASDSDDRTMTEDEFDGAVALLAEEEARIKGARRDGEAELLAEEIAFEERSTRETEALAAEQEKTRAAIRQTAEIRRATRSDREALETAEGEASRLRRKVRKLEEENRNLQAGVRRTPTSANSEAALRSHVSALKGEVSKLGRRLAEEAARIRRAQFAAEDVTLELSESVRRARHLIETLRLSEADLAACRRARKKPAPPSETSE